MAEQITLNRRVYAQLVEDQSKLRALEAAGVDNWEGFEHAMGILREEEEG